MERTPVTSSMILSIGYEADTRTLEVEFKQQAVYQYSEVPPEEYDAFMVADSHGKYFLANIKNRYPTIKL